MKTKKLILSGLALALATTVNAMWIDPEECRPTTYLGSSTWNFNCKGETTFTETVKEDYNNGSGKRYPSIKRWMLRIKQREWETHPSLKWLPYEGADARRTVNVWVGIRVNWKKFTNKRLDEAYRCMEGVKDVWGHKAVYTTQGQCVARLTRIQLKNVRYTGTSGKGVNGKKHYTTDKAEIKYFWRAIEMGAEKPPKYTPKPQVFIFN